MKVTQPVKPPKSAKRKRRTSQTLGGPPVLLLKPFKIPDGFKIVIDTREQQSIFKDGDELESILEHRALKNGDYSISGYEDMFAIERKKMSDLYSYCGSEFRDKTADKLSRFKDMIKRGGWVGLIIQATENTVLGGNFHSKLPSEVVRQQIASFEVKYGIHVYYNKYSRNLRRWSVDRMLKFYKYETEMWKV